MILSTIALIWNIDHHSFSLKGHFAREWRDERTCCSINENNKWQLYIYCSILKLCFMTKFYEVCKGGEKVFRNR